HIAFDALELARQHGTEANAVLLGALAGSGAVPISEAAFRKAIEAKGVAVKSNLAGFDLGLALARSPSAAGSATTSAAAAAAGPAGASSRDAPLPVAAPGGLAAAAAPVPVPPANRAAIGATAGSIPEMGRHAVPRPGELGV